MKFGVREICDVVLRAKARMQVGNKIFYKNEPVIYFDTLKTSSMEGAATTVYAQGGRGNSRLVAWEGERTVTFTMEDALISPEGFMILSGAGLVEASSTKAIYQHVTERIDGADIDFGTDGVVSIPLSQQPWIPSNQGDNLAYVMFMRNDEIITEPYIPEHKDVADSNEYTFEPNEEGKWVIEVKSHACYDDSANTEVHYDMNGNSVPEQDYIAGDLNKDTIRCDSVLVDYYVARKSAAKQIEIRPDQFGGNFYLEASTLFRDQNGVDMPAEFIIPNCKIQSNFTFTMASSGDPSSFTFTMDAFPDYTRFDHSKKVLAAIQIIEEAGSAGNIDYHRGATPNGSYAITGGENQDIHEDLWSERVETNG